MGYSHEDTYLLIEEAFSMALEVVKDNPIPRDKIYVWRQRFRDGNLSHKKVEEILERAGFKKVVTEKWIKLRSKMRS